MRLFGGGDEFITDIDLQKTSAGTNLLVGSKDWATNTAIYGSVHALDEKYLNGKIFALPGTGINNSLQIQNLSSGTQIAWSVWAKSTGTAILHTEVNGGAGSKDIKLGSDWARVSSCGAPQGSGLLFFWNNTPNSEIDLCLPKVELGSIATQWCPAPEDYVMKSNYVTSNITENVMSWKPNSMDVSRNDYTLRFSASTVANGRFVSKFVKVYPNETVSVEVNPLANKNFMWMYYLVGSPQTGSKVYNPSANWENGSSATFNTGNAKYIIFLVGNNDGFTGANTWELKFKHNVNLLIEG